MRRPSDWERERHLSYTVLARRYRSQSFDDVVGQEPIARTLQNAIAQNRVAHAYLFVGTRGVGKTSMARIFAKALNGGSPEIDSAIMSGQDTDVIEIDAASNRGVDEARDLIANSEIHPLRGGYKVYIIDEVHMLTREAFNALLKTMEEPPSHVKFILCTTEPHKVPPTIQSRCQRFDFCNISSTRIAEHLAGVIESEGANAEPALVHLVAKMGNGSMRDALSLLDRLLAAGEEELSVELLERLLGLPDHDLIDQLLEAISAGDAASALQAADQLLVRGVAIDQFLETLLNELRDLMVLCVCGGATDLVDLADDRRERLSKLSSSFDGAGVIHMIALCESVQRAVKSSSAPRALLDALIVRLSMTERLADIGTILSGAPTSAVKGSSRKKA